jgi:hypothetical protein
MSLVLAVAPLAQAAGRGAAPKPRSVPHGTLEVLNGYTVVSVEGTPGQMGTAYGTLLKPLIQRVVRAVITQGVCEDPEARANILAGSRTMARFQPKNYLAELRAIAKAAEVDYQELLLLQYFGDVRRAIEGRGSSSFCTSFAALPPNTAGGICLVGRNFDYFDQGVGEYARLLAHYRPKGKIPFVTVTWAGVINGWTLLSERGIVCSNNTAFGARSNSLEGISTCFLLRTVAERARSVDEGVALVRKGPRACGTAMLIASGRPPNAAIVEFDHDRIAVIRPKDGFVGAANSFQSLYQEERDWGDADASGYWGRLGAAYEVVQEHRGRLDTAANPAGADGVPIVGMNLHSANIDATNRRLAVAMGRIPACELPYKTFRLTDHGLVQDGLGPQSSARPASANKEQEGTAFWPDLRWAVTGPAALLLTGGLLARARRRSAPRSPSP